MNRITFPGNPWPAGHGIKQFEWSGRLEPETGLWFDLHLCSEDYYAEDEAEEEEDDNKETSDWKSKVVWSNYHECTLSSSCWGHAGFLVATRSKQLDFSKLGTRAFRVDRLPAPEPEDRAFGIYLLGHDGVADHRLQFSPRRGKSKNDFDLDWKGKIALEYAGNDEFEFKFHAHLRHIHFAGFRVPKGTKQAAALDLLAPFIAGKTRYRSSRRKGELWLVPM
ncbi:MAG: hypothetical protein AB7K24_31725 [Gemmataceae bacterium]